MRAKNPICPMCKERPKAPGRHYCRYCEAEKFRQYQKGGNRVKTCPLCGAKFVAPGKTYCEKCRKLSHGTRSKRMRKKEEEDKMRRNAAAVFAELKAEASQINWRYVRGCGIVTKQPEEQNPKKKELTLIDFIGRDNEPSIWRNL